MLILNNVQTKPMKKKAVLSRESVFLKFHLLIFFCFDYMINRLNRQFALSH